MELKISFDWQLRVSCIEHGPSTTLTEEEARALYGHLHARFGDFDQARELSQLARESVARDLKLAEIEAAVQMLKAEYVHVGPTLEDDIESMIASRGGKHAENPWDLVTGIVPESESREVDDADEQEAEFLSRLPQIAVASDVADSPSTVNGIPVGELTMPPVSKFDPTPCCSVWPWCDCNDTPKPPAEPEKAPEPTAPSNDQQVRSPRTNETDAEKCVRLWLQYRAKYPKASDTQIVGRVRAHIKRLSNNDVRRILRECGLAVADPTPRREVILNARKESPRGNPPRPGRRITNPPDGYKVIDPAVWEANAPLFSHAEIRELASGGLARIGLAIGTSEGDDW